MSTATALVAGRAPTHGAAAQVEHGIGHHPRVPATLGCALAALRYHYPDGDEDNLADLAQRAVDVMVQHPGHGGQVAAVAAVVRQARLDAPSGTDTAAWARHAAAAIVAAVTGDAARWPTGEQLAVAR